MTEIDSFSLCDVAFHCTKWEICHKDLDRLIPQILDQVRKTFSNFLSTGHVDLILADNAFIQDLNYRYRGQNRPTNVLSFPQSDFKKGKIEPEDEFVLLGDIVMAYEVIAHEAKQENKPFLDHFSHLLVHGMLHLLGFDHETNDDQQEMESFEVKILSKIGISNPYEN
tara:strand:+ start:24 stop:527 length:504 start_codon:yes stop_codon:yes gene_type:complete